MFLFGLIAIVFAIYGMASVKKDITDDAFGVITTIAKYTTGVTDTVDRLMDTIGGVSGIIDDFQTIIVTDLDIDGIMTNLTVSMCPRAVACASVLDYPEIDDARVRQVLICYPGARVYVMHVDDGTLICTLLLVLQHAMLFHADCRLSECSWMQPILPTCAPASQRCRQHTTRRSRTA
jgi:hypothetical protein